jgi:hypothetical protein
VKPVSSTRTHRHSSASLVTQDKLRANSATPCRYTVMHDRSELYRKRSVISRLMKLSVGPSSTPSHSLVFLDPGPGVACAASLFFYLYLVQFNFLHYKPQTHSCALHHVRSLVPRDCIRSLWLPFHASCSPVLLIIESPHSQHSYYQHGAFKSSKNYIGWRTRCRQRHANRALDKTLSRAGRHKLWGFVEEECPTENPSRYV